MRWVCMALLVVACGDDDGGLRDAAADVTRDTAPDSADGGFDAAIDVGADAPADVGGDAPVSMPCTAPGECQPFDGTSCAAGEVCVLRSSGRTQCRRATDIAALGEPCVRMEDCLPGLMCVNTDGASTCKQTCAGGSIGACGGGDRCSGSIGDACVLFCRPRAESCDIYAQDCADPADACTFATDPETDEFYTGCRTAGPNALGDVCGSTDGFCMPGLVCIRRDAAATCHEVCDADAPTDTCSLATEVCEGLSSSWRVTYCRPTVAP